MMKKHLFISNSVQATQTFAAKLGKVLQGGEVILLVGDLGGGKTTFVQGLAKSLGIKDHITSPTFVLKKIYSTKLKLNMEHLDLYRLNKNEITLDPTLLENFGKADIIAIVEWGEKIQNTLDDYLRIKFQFIDPQKRKIEVSAFGKKAKKTLKLIQS